MPAIVLGLGFAFLPVVPNGMVSLLSSAQYVSALLCTGQADIANSTAFSMTVSTKFCTKYVAACVGIESYILHLMLANLEVLNMF